MTAHPADTPTFDCLVLSGGGAKGAYGVGAAHALHLYYEQKGIDRTICYIGASAGALTAAMLAGHGSEETARQWRQMTNRKILGTRRQRRWLRTGVRYLRHWASSRFDRSRVFSLYDNSGLRALIEKQINMSMLSQKHVIVVATNYNTAEPLAFYHSDALHKSLSTTGKDNPALKRFVCLDDDTHIRAALVASAAIPFFFPPVKICNDWFIDGGVGNNTPLREAALFLRYVSSARLGKPGDTYCIRQDNPRRRIEVLRPPDSSDVIKRTLDIFEYSITDKLLHDWMDINSNLERLPTSMAQFEKYLGDEGVDSGVLQKAKELFGRRGRYVDQLELPINPVEPSTDLGDTLDFQVDHTKELIRHGINDMAKRLESAGKVKASEAQEIRNCQLPGE